MTNTMEVMNEEIDIALPEIGFWEKQLEAISDKALTLGIRVLFAAIVLLVSIKIANILRKLLRRTLERSSMDNGAIHFVDSCLKIALYGIIAMFLASSFGVDATSIVALVGSAGLTLGLALQGSLSNFAGGVLILLIKPFTIGDFIIEDTHKNEGTVQRIDIFYTTLLTFDNKTIVIPNGTLANSSLTNVTGMGKRLLQIRVGISYEADISKAKELVKKLLLEEDSTLKDEPMAVFVDELGQSAVFIGCRSWVKSEDYFPAKWRLTEAIKLTFDKHGIQIPYNQLEVHLNQ